jgi:hypothetical protein
MAERRSPNDEYGRLMDALAQVSRLTFVTMSVFAVVLTVAALVAIAVMLIVAI